MKFTSEVTITGGKAYNNTIDGVSHNFTKIFVMTDLSAESGFGSATVEYKWGSAENAKKISHLPTPFNAKVDMEIVTTGNRQTTIVHNVTPITQK
ncbi:hypothetical protein [Acinetobacter puyangensis]|uniref:hypothetical protein n=1 Tax=Acinetobacter puyangensis TaxID=1096779 RepID=UPI003A4DA69F